MFDNFPYTNFHEMNLDWMIKIAKDFLDQYTSIQETITTGLESINTAKSEAIASLNDRADVLTTLLNEWYDTHSEDIANELADALQSLNDWYNQHSNDIQNELTQALASFQAQATAYVQQVIESIPQDYSNLANAVYENSKAIENNANMVNQYYLCDMFTISETTQSGLTCSDAVGGMRVVGTQTDVVIQNIYNGAVPDSLEIGKRYYVEFPHNKPVHLQIYGYNENDSARQLYDSNNITGYFAIPAEYSSRILIRLRFPTTGTTWNDILYPFIYKEVNKNTIAAIENKVNLNLIESCTYNGITVTVDKNNGTITVDGTASGNVEMYITGAFTDVSQVIATGGAAGGSSNTYYIGIYDEVTHARVGYVDGTEDTYKIITLDKTHAHTGRIYVLNGVTVNNAVFTPSIWSSEYLYDITNNTPVGVNTWRYYNGLAGIAVCGGKIFIDCESFRMFNIFNRSYSDIIDGTTTIDIDDDITTVRYIHFTGTGFTMDRTDDATTIAVIVNKLVTALTPGIIEDHRLIQDGYIKIGTPYHLNFNRAGFKAYSGYDNPDDIKIADHAYIFTTTGRKNYNYNKVAAHFTLLQNTANVANKKVLMIGDSFVARGYMQHFLSQFEPTLQFIGTKNTQFYNFKSEGVSGSRLYYFTDPATSPFWYNGQLDFNAYLNVNNLPTPDYVIINSAINHSSYFNSEYGSYHQNLMSLIDMIQSFDSNIKIYVTYGANYAMEIPSSYGYPNMRQYEVLKCANSVYDTEDVTIIPLNSALIDDLDYTKSTYNYYGNTITMYDDCVHPDENTGFKKLAEMIYNYLGM